MNKNSGKIIIAVAIVIAVGAGSFYGGMVYAKGNRATASGLRNLGQFPQGANTRRIQGDGGLVNGQIINKDDKSITIQLANNGGSKIVFYSEVTNIGKIASGSVSDLVVGENVTATGSANSDGSLTAQMIQIRPAGMEINGGAGFRGGAGVNNPPTQN